VVEFRHDTSYKPGKWGLDPLSCGTHSCLCSRVNRKDVAKLSTPLYVVCVAGSSVADVLRSARKAKGQSLRSAARELGVDPSYLSRVETGERQPSADLCQRAGSLYEIDGDSLALSAGDIPADIVEILRRHPELLVEIRVRYGQSH